MSLPAAPPPPTAPLRPTAAQPAHTTPPHSVNKHNKPHHDALAEQHQKGHHQTGIITTPYLTIPYFTTLRYYTKDNKLQNIKYSSPVAECSRLSQSGRDYHTAVFEFGVLLIYIMPTIYHMRDMTSATM